MGRGVLTTVVQACARRVLGRHITQTELRLMPYVQFVMMNNQRIEPGKVSGDERRILQEWREAGWIEAGAGGLAISKKFWDAINEILWRAYVCPGED